METEEQVGSLNWSRAPEFGRRQTLINALKRLNGIKPEGACIVETGTSRDPSSREGDGWSTVAFGWYCFQTGGRTHTVDIAPEAIEACRGLTRNYADNIEYIRSDSLAFLRNWRNSERCAIDFLYLDSLDYVDYERSEKHHLAEAKAALHALAPNCLVLIDDTCPTGPCDLSGAPPLTGKGARAVPYLLGKGFELEWCAGNQALLSRGVRSVKSDYPFGISAIVHTRNEARRIADCLQSLQGWTEEIIVCDMESSDDTVDIALQHGARIVPHPFIANFDSARNISA